MKRSAAASRSAVVTPGRTLPASRSMVRTRISPARAILSISAGDFLTIMALKSLEPLFEPQRRQRRADVVVHLDLVPRAVEPSEESAVVVVVLERLGLLVVSDEALADLLGLVVVALVQRLAALGTHVVVLGRIERHVVQVPVGALAPAGQALDDHVVGCVDRQHCREVAAALVHLLGQRVGLGAGAREAV